MEYNGGSVVAMVGKDCVGIASDKRFGIRFETVTMDFEKCFKMGQQVFLGLSGLATDVQTVKQKADFRVKLYELRENRQIRPKTLMHMMSSLLYQQRFGPFFVEPIIAGLDQKDNFRPYIASCDLIGCPLEAEDFVVTGTCEKQLYGMCESLWEPNMDADHLRETISQALLNAQDRDAYTGWGAVVHIIEKDKVTTSHLRSRMD
ncbi:hypothetical protein SNEBB_004559 [Seison nebaliae]|nr:hypothetical protein SNEBB_004559 [Seison nebaliae]